MAKSIEIPPAEVTATAQSVAAAIEQAARPGPVPTPAVGSPIDAAAATVANAVIKNVAACSADLAPKSAEILAKSKTALADLQGRDAQNAARIRAVPAGMGWPNPEAV